MKQKLMTLPQHLFLREMRKVLETPQRRKENKTKPEQTTDRVKPPKEKAISSPLRLTKDVTDFLIARYDFRYNVLTEETEFRPAGERTAAFRMLGKRELNTFCLEAHAEGIACWDKDLSRYIYSTYVPSYHPFHLYMDELPAWDGCERLQALARRVSDSPLWVDGFHTWMLALAAQWMGLSDLHANSVAPILVSTEQGQQKSTFCKSLMPPLLQRYYCDNLKLTSQGEAERMLAEMGLLNMDEFDKYPLSRMPLLKNLMQMAAPTLRKAYQHNFRPLPRIASFIGTSNRFDLLTDPTGSRRFLCVEVKHKINCEDIRHDQILAQLKAELASGGRSWFTKEDERALQAYNVSRFYRRTVLETLFFEFFRAASPSEKGLEMTASGILKELCEHRPSVVRGCDAIQMGQALVRAGLVRKHTEYGNVYRVVRR